MCPFFIFSFPKKGEYAILLQKCKCNRMRVNMSEGNYQNSPVRRKRVQALKKIIVISLLIAVLIPVVCCAILFVRVHRLHHALDDMAASLEALNQKSIEQQELLQQWMDAQTIQGQGDMLTGQASAEVPDTGHIVNETSKQTGADSQEAALHKVYLTFDDGPSIYTEEILDILDRYQVKATFFVVGKKGSASAELLQQIVEKGHTLGLHSYSHKYEELYQSVEAFSKDLEQIQDYVYQATGYKSTFFRFPGGSSNTISKIDMSVFADCLAEQGIEFFDWNISSGDGGSRLLDVNTLVKNCTEGITDKENAIILLHDAAEKKTTVEALPLIIENILAMEDTVILPITEDTRPVHHIDTNGKEWR